MFINLRNVYFFCRMIIQLFTNTGRFLLQQLEMAIFEPVVFFHMSENDSLMPFQL